MGWKRGMKKKLEGEGRGEKEGGGERGEIECGRRSRGEGEGGGCIGYLLGIN